MQWKHVLSDTDLGEEEAVAVANVIRSKWLSAGELTAKFESEFQSMFGIHHAVATNSCTAALHLALMALDIGPGDEVLVPSYTFVASANAILYRGATPVFVDIVDSKDLNLDPQDLVRKTTKRTKAIIVVHFAGFLADMNAILRHARKHQIWVVEDACHAIGSRYGNLNDEATHGRFAGTMGDIGCFSFFANKNLVTGEGGMLVTQDERIAQIAKSLRSHGMTKSSWDKVQGRATDYDITRLGYNYRPTEMTSALGRIQLRKLEQNNRKRSGLVAIYRERLTHRGDVVIPFCDENSDASNHIFPILVERNVRNKLRERLTQEGIQTSIHYPPVHHFTHYRSLNQEPCSLPVTEEVAEREITLPLHPLMETSDVHDICDVLIEALDEVNKSNVN